MSKADWPIEARLEVNEAKLEAEDWKESAREPFAAQLYVVANDALIEPRALQGKIDAAIVKRESTRRRAKEPMTTKNAKDQLSMFLGSGGSKAPKLEQMPAQGTEWSGLQLAIYDELMHGAGNLAIEARAGSGKTTTSVEGIKRMSRHGRVLYAAFNRPIADAVKPKLAHLKNVDVKTLNGLGFSILKQLDKNVQLDQDKGIRIAREVAPPNAQQKFVTAIKRAAAFCKSLNITDLDLAETALFDQEIDAEPFATGRELAQLALRAMHASTQMLGLVDFDDQQWLPVHLDLPNKWGYDFVFIDEAQDMNETQLKLCMRSVNPDGRIVIIGDPKQAIYAFRGADLRMYDRLVERLGAKKMPLTITYRCARRIVQEANKMVPDLEAAPTAPEGTLKYISPIDMRKMMQPGDFVISRSNAALVRECTAAIRAGIKSNIQGRDLGETLRALVQKSRADDVEELLAWVEDWKVREIEKRTKKDHDTQPVVDRAECLVAFADGARSIGEVMRNIAVMFDEGDDTQRVVFSTTHRVKGLERKRVFVLRDTYLRPRYVKDEFGSKVFMVPEEEQNLYYVAVTRAIEELYLVTVGRGEEDEEDIANAQAAMRRFGAPGFGKRQ